MANKTEQDAAITVIGGQFIAPKCLYQERKMVSNQCPILPPKKSRRDENNFNKSKQKKRNNKDMSQNKTIK